MDMIWVMTILSKYVENHGRVNVFIYVLINLKKEIKKDIVSVMKTKTHTFIALPRRTLLYILYYTHKNCLFVCFYNE